MRYLLDTNVISNAVKLAPSASLLQWMGAQRDGDMFLSALTIAEIWRGILEMPSGKRRDQLEIWFNGAEGPLTLFAGRILVFDESAALVWARLMAAGKLNGRPRSSMDTIIAAVAVVHNCVVVTDNEKDFEGVETFNPMGV
jgi:toxin FitB